MVSRVRFESPVSLATMSRNCYKKMDQEISTALGKEQSDDVHLGPNSLHFEYSCSDTLVSAESHSAAAHNGDMDPKETSATTN